MGKSLNSDSAESINTLTDEDKEKLLNAVCTIGKLVKWSECFFKNDTDLL